MKTVNVPVRDFAKTGNTLAEWLGHFWTRIYENIDLVKSSQQGNGLLAAQLYLDFLEYIDLIGRNTVPVFHRERWHPIIIRRSQANTGNANMLRIGMDPTPVIGAQTAAGFVQGDIFQIGGHAEYTSSISYPLDDNIADILTCVTNNILSPSSVMIRGTDFLVRENTIFFLRTNDPFANSEYPVRTVTNPDGTTDEELLLWASDTLFDRDYVYNHIGYVLGIKAQSTEFYQRAINEMHAAGGPISNSLVVGNDDQRKTFFVEFLKKIEDISG